MDGSTGIATFLPEKDVMTTRVGYELFFPFFDYTLVFFGRFFFTMVWKIRDIRFVP